MLKTNPDSLEGRARGRPREFVYDEVVDKAIAIFSQRGYHGTSIGNLADATGIATGSLYKAFKDKRELFLACLAKVRAERSATLEQIAAGPETGRDKIRQVLQMYAELSQGADGQQGCMVVGCAADLASFDPEIANRVSIGFRANEAVLERLIREGYQDGSIPGAINPLATARFMYCAIQGMRIIGKTGRSRDELNEIVNAAMKLFELQDNRTETNG